MSALLGRARLAVPVAVRGSGGGRAPAAGTGGLDSAELTAPADHFTAHGIALEMLAESLRGAVLELAEGSPGR